MLKPFLSFLLVLIFSTVQTQILYWGITNKGGQNNVGTIFYTDRNGNEQNIVHSFNYGDGDSPIGSLILASDDKLYGTTIGGNIDFGVIFQFDYTLFQYQKMVAFNGGTEGFHPTGHLVNYPDGKIYGMTRNGGEDQSGVIFEYVPGETDISVKKYFTGIDGAFPEGGLTVAANGLLYGLTSYGGEFNSGVLFMFDPATDDYEKLHDFNPLDGMIPVCNLLQASNGKLYGVTPKGGDFNSGVLFEYDLISETYTKLIDFNGQNAGSDPAGSLLEAGNGLLYGMTIKDLITEENSYGTIYAYDIINFQIHKLFSFNGADGASPTGSLIEADNNILIGLTDKGGTANAGVRFEFDIANNIFTKKIDFNGENGQLPIYASMLKVYYLDIEENNIDRNMKVYPSPATNFMCIDLQSDIKSFEYKLFSMEGALIDQGHIENNKAVILTEQIHQGTYILFVNAEGVTASKKVVIR